MTKVMFEDWGLAMCAGSIPMAALLGGIGDYANLNFLRAYRREKAARRARHLLCYRVLTLAFFGLGPTISAGPSLFGTTGSGPKKPILG